MIFIIERVIFGTQFGHDKHLFWQIKRKGGSYADFYARAKMDRKALKVGESVNGLLKMA